MNHITYRISLDLRKTESGVVVRVKRDDTVKKLAISLTDGGKPYHITEDCSAVFAGEKPDGTILCNDCAIEDCVVTYEITPQTIAELGEVESEIRLYNTDGDLATSPSFTILVVPPVYDDDRVIESHDEVNALTDLITGANSTIQKGEEVVRTGKALFDSLQDKEEELNARAEEVFGDLLEAKETLVSDANSIFNGFQDKQEELIAEAKEVLDSMPKTYVSFDQQNPTAEEAAQARENIGAASQEDVNSFRSRLADGSVTFVDEREGNTKTLFLGQEDLYLTGRGGTVTVLTSGNQYLTEEQQTQARGNIGAASTDSVVQKDTVASVESVKINHSPKTSDAIFLEGAAVSDKDDLLVNALTLRGDSYGGVDADSVILRNVHAGEEENDAATVGQVVRIDQAQNLSEEQKAQARENIGVTPGGDVNVDLTGYVKDTDYATADKAGVVKAGMGLSMVNGAIQVEYAKESQITNKNSYRNPITPINLDLAVKTGITTNQLPLTAEEQQAAKDWLGVTENGGGTGELPSALPNPHKLTFTGAVNAEYDGSEAVEVNIPAGGGTNRISIPWLKDGYELMGKATLLEEAQRWVITQTDDGVAFSNKKYTEIVVTCTMYACENSTASNAAGCFWINHPGGGNNLQLQNCHHKGATRVAEAYAITHNNKRYYVQATYPHYEKTANDDGRGHIYQIVFDTGNSTNIWGANSAVEIWGRV